MRTRDAGAFVNRAGSLYIAAMPSVLRLTLMTVLAAMTLAALAGWSMYGTSILFTYAQAGIAWCF